MYSRMVQQLNRTDNLYPTPQQQKELLDYARSCPRRFAACRAIEASEDALVGRVLAAVSPDDIGWTRAEADLRGLLRTVAVGVLIDDADYATAVWSQHLTSLLDALDAREVGETALTELKRALADSLPPDAAELVAPYLDAAAAPFLVSA